KTGLKAVLGAVAALAFTAAPELWAQEAQPAQEVAAGAASRLPVDGPWYANHELPMQSDGNLPGRVQVFNSTGSLVPAQVRVFVLKDGRVVHTTDSDAEGSFQLVGLPAG